MKGEKRVELISIQFKDAKTRNKDQIVTSFIMSQILDEKNTGAIVGASKRGNHYEIMILHKNKCPLKWEYGDIHIDHIQEDDLNGLANYWSYYRLFEVKN